MKKVHVFLGWSGRVSYEVALGFSRWLPRVVQSIQPKISDAIPKGTSWTTELATVVKAADLSIFFLTPQNLQARWMHYEAGASQRVCPFLFEVTQDALLDPMNLWQSCRYDKQEVRNLVGDLASLCEGPSDEVLDETFELWWPMLTRELDALLQDSKNAQSPIISSASSIPIRTGCDTIYVYPDRTTSPYSTRGWLRDKLTPSGMAEVIVLARTAKFWKDEIEQGNLVPGREVKVRLVVADPAADTRMLAEQERPEFLEHMKDILPFLRAMARNESADSFQFLLAPSLVMDSFTFVDIVDGGHREISVVLDIYTGTRHDEPRPQIAFIHEGTHTPKGCIVRRMEDRARRILKRSGTDLHEHDQLSEAIEPLRAIEQEPSRRNPVRRLAGNAVEVFKFYEQSRLFLAAKKTPTREQINRPPPPVCVQVEVTDRCHVRRCLGCTRGLANYPTDMDLKLYEELMISLREINTRNVVLSGGEPLAHRQAARLLEIARHQEMHVAVLTDGLSLANDDSLVEEVGRSVSSLRISLDGVTADSYRDVRFFRKNHPFREAPVAHVERAIANMKAFREDDHSPLEHIGICTTLFERNAQEVERVRAWARDQPVDSVVFKFAHGTPETIGLPKSKGFACSEGTVEQLVNLFAAAQRESDGSLLDNSPYMEGFIREMGAGHIASGKPTSGLYEKKKMVCFTPLLFALVDPKGGINICCHTYFDNSEGDKRRDEARVGYIGDDPNKTGRKRSFKDIWEEEAFERVRRIHGWNADEDRLDCKCPMRGECTRHWRHNLGLTQVFRDYLLAGISGQRSIEKEIRDIAMGEDSAFWL